MIVKLPRKLGKNAVQLALIPILGLGLMVVLWKNAQPRTSAATTANAILPATTAPPPFAQTTKSREVVWPAVQLEPLLAFDPFQPLAQGPPPAAAVGEALTSGPHESGRVENVVVRHKVDLIYASPQGTVAIVDSQPVRIGDQLAEGRVVDITAQDVVIELTTPPLPSDK